MVWDAYDLEAVLTAAVSSYSAIAIGGASSYSAVAIGGDWRLRRRQLKAAQGAYTTSLAYTEVLAFV